MSAGEDRAGRGALLDLRDLLGAFADTARARFGPPAVDRRVGRDRWLRFEGAGWSLRVRARPRRTEEGARIRSWTVACERGFDTLGDALRAFSLDRAAPTPEGAELRLPLRDTAGRVHSLTASRRGGRIHAVSAFDEPPEWLPDAPLTPR